MVITCPNCKNPLRVKKEDTEFICYKCGTIMIGDHVAQIGVASYKFKDDVKEYIIVFNTEDEGLEFTDIVKKYINQYEWCCVKTPTGTYLIV